MSALFKILATCALLLSGYLAQAQTVRYYHTDALGSVVAVTDPNRNVLERREYEPYGAQLSPTVQDGPGYTGHVQDAATGLVYMQQRYYDPMLGVFLSVDPVTAYSNPISQFHRYRYANNNPYKFTDPDGRAAICLVPGPMQICMAAAAKVVNVIGLVGTATYAAYKGNQYLNESAAETGNGGEGNSGGEVVISDKIRSARGPWMD